MHKRVHGGNMEQWFVGENVGLVTTPFGDPSGYSASPLLHELKSQVSFFFKERIKTARLALTDVTPTELLTEEATNGDPWTPNTRTMGLISRAAFEVDDYWRIVDILHKRLERFDRKNWRPSYKALIILEHLLTHGPERVGEEFQSDKDVFREIRDFQYVDEKGFNWGSSVRKKSELVLKLLEDKQFLKEERIKARKLTRGIKGFGSFSFHQQYSTSSDESLKGSKPCLRSNSQFNDQNQEHVVLDSNVEFSVEERIGRAHGTCLDLNSKSEKSARKSNSWLSNGDGYSVEVVHPFCDSEHYSKASLLSSTS